MFDTYYYMQCEEYFAHISKISVIIKSVFQDKT